MMKSVLSLFVASGFALSLAATTQAAVITGGSATWTVNEGFASSLGWLDANFSEGRTRGQTLSDPAPGDAYYNRISGQSGTLGTPTVPGFGYTAGQVMVGDSIRPFGVAPLNDAGGTTPGVPGSSRTRQATTLDFDPNDVLGTWSKSNNGFAFTGNTTLGEQIAFTNMQRWGGPFTGALVYGDFGLRYNTSNELVLTSNIDFLNAEFVTIGSPAISLLDSDTLQITGNLLVGEGLFVLDSSAVPGTNFGTITITADFAPAVPGPGAPALLGIGGLVAARRRRS